MLRLAGFGSSRLTVSCVVPRSSTRSAERRGLGVRSSRRGRQRSRHSRRAGRALRLVAVPVAFACIEPNKMMDELDAKD